MKFARLLLCCLGLLILSSPAQANLIANGNFEKTPTPGINGQWINLYELPGYSLPDWTIRRQVEIQNQGTGGGSNKTQVAEFAGTMFYPGTSTIVGAGAISQSVSMVRGATYELTFDYYNRNYWYTDPLSRALGGVGVSLGGVSLYQTSAAEMQVGDYRTLSTSFIYTGATGSSIFAIGGFPNNEGVGGLVDNISLTMTKAAPTPIPGAVLLLGTGVAGLAALRRKFKA